LARLKRTGGVLVGVAGAQSGPPTTVIRADPEPLGVVGTFPAPPFQPIVDVLIQAVSDDGAVSLVGCDVSTEPLAAFVQTRDDDGKDLLLRPDTGLDAEPCADAVQGQLLLRHEASHVVQEVEPVPNARGIRTRTGLLLPFDDDAGASAEVPVEGLAFNYVKIEFE
jgi:hypothetical protein